MTPLRLQRRRGKGGGYYDRDGNRYDPKDVVYVGRGSKWGNPFSGILAYTVFKGMVMEFKADGPLKWYPFESIADLRGKHLACWCGFDKQCHADVLLELANKEDE